MAAPRRPDPPPLQTNEFAPIMVGTAVWGVAFVILLSRHHSLAAHGHGWYVWVGLSGFLLGFWGLSLMVLHRRGRRRAQSRSTSASSSEVESTPRSSSVPK